MLPKAHVILGAIFSILVYYIFHITIFQASLIFLASVFIDIDHYLFHLNRKKSFSLKEAYYFHKNLPKNHKPMMHFLHTIEIIILIFILSFVWQGFFFIFIGMMFHSLLDVFEMAYNKELKCREFFLIRYMIHRNKREKYL